MLKIAFISSFVHSGGDAHILFLRKTVNPYMYCKPSRNHKEWVTETYLHGLS